jgi:multiple sugar transport system substrate-binding protein
VSPAAATVLRGLTWDHPRGLDSVRGAAAAYEQLHPQIRVEWEARSLQGFADQPLDVLVRTYDLLVIDHPHIPHAAANGLLATLDGRGHDDELAELAIHAIGPSHGTYANGNRQYGLAIDAAAQVGVYRPDLLPVPPATWPEVLELARTGRVVWPAKPVDAISSFLTLAANRGAPVALNGFVNRDAGEAILEDLHHLAELVDPACLDENPIQAAERLATDDRSCYAPLAFGYTNYGRAGFRRHRLAYIDMPTGPGGVSGSCLGGAGIAVSAFTPHPEAAVAHAFWLASGDVQRGVYFAAGGQPAHVAAWDDDALDAESLGFFRGTRRTLEGAWVRPRFDGWLRVQDEVGILVNQALRHELGDTACLDAADRVVARAREDGGT